MLCHLLKTFLRREGYHVITASDGLQAIEAAHSHQGNIDILLTDVRMPYMSGPDLARALQRDRPSVRVMLMSGYPIEPFPLEQGWMFVQKPFRPETIIEQVRNALPEGNTDAG